MLPAAWVKVPLTVRVPIELPGATMPLFVTVPMMVPRRRDCRRLSTVTLLMMLPLTARRPFETVVGPV